MTKGEIAKGIFEQGYSCAQAVLMAYSEELGLDKTTAAKVSCGLGGGIARSRETCGAVIGAIMAIGLKHSDGSADDKVSVYEISRKFMDEFKSEFGTDNCGILLGLTKNEAQVPTPEARTKEYYEKRPCADMVEFAANAAEKYL